MRPPLPRAVLPLRRLAAVVALAMPGFVAAQSLAELYDAARAADATYLAARANAASARYRAEQVESLMRPNVLATASATAGQSDTPFTQRGDANALQGGITGRLPIFNRANDATIAQARRLLETAQADLDAAEQDLILRLSQAYFDVLAAQDTLATSQASRAAITEQLSSAKRNFEVGTATITDTREAQARFDLATAQQLAAENDLRTRRIALETLVGRAGIVPKTLVVPVALPATVPPDADAWVTAADRQHPLVRRARVALDIAQLETEKARAATLPTLDAVGTVGTNFQRGSAATLPGRSSNAAVGLQMNWPLYTGGSTQSRVEETLLLEEKARNDLEAARRAVSQGTRTAYYGVQSGQAQVNALEAAESSSKLALEATQLGYKVGVRVNLDVLNAQTQLFQTQRDLARARYDVLLGGLRLRQAAGQLTPQDVETINRLLATR